MRIEHRGRAPLSRRLRPDDAPGAMSPKGGAIDCREFVEVVTTYLERAVDDRKRAQIDTHLENCDGCRAYLQQCRSTIATLARLDAPSFEPLRDRLLRSFALRPPPLTAD